MRCRARSKRRDIPVAGADRLSLPGHIAVKDLIALGRFLIQPEDDLSLAAVLRSPIFGLAEDALFALAAEPARQPCRWQPRCAPAAETRCRADGGRRPARRLGERSGVHGRSFEFYAGVLGAATACAAKMIARLGHEAGDILDEFLSFCLAEERTGLPGLEAFLSTLENAGPEIKREMDQTRDEVRIMTVHAAKGLEAPVVFLVDGGSAPFSDQHLPRLMPFVAARHSTGTARAISGAPAADVANAFSKACAVRPRKDLADDEYRRLLYVGMTRAEDRLIVCGYHGKRAPSTGTWHSIVSRALVGAPESEQRDAPRRSARPVHRFRVTTLPPQPRQCCERSRATANAGRRALAAKPVAAPLPPFEDLPRAAVAFRRLGADRRGDRSR